MQDLICFTRHKSRNSEGKGAILSSATKNCFFLTSYIKRVILRHMGEQLYLTPSKPNPR